MNKYKKLMSNSIIFTIGNFGSKILNIILVPLYTFYLSTSQFGKVDLVTTTVGLLVPIASLSVADGAMRYAIEKNSDKEKILTNALFLVTITSISISIIGFVLYSIGLLNYIYAYFILILIFQMVYTLLSQFVRGIEKVTLFIVSGMIFTLSLGLLNIIFIVFLKLSVVGYLLSFVLANLISIAVLIPTSYRFVNLKKISKSYIKILVVYSVPLIPNAVIWWFINSSSRYFILFYIGVSANGIFAVANKIPSLLTMVSNIFNQAWQMSAFEEINTEEKNKFFSSVFERYMEVLVLFTAILLIVLKPLMKIMVSSSYYSSWKYIPLLSLAVVLSSYSSFIGTNYLAAKNTKGIFFSSILGGIVSIILNFILVPTLGLNGVGIAICISFLITCIYRYYDTRKIVSYMLPITKLSAVHLLLVAQVISLLFQKNIIFSIAIGTSLILIILIDMFLHIIRNVRKHYQKEI